MLHAEPEDVDSEALGANLLSSFGYSHMLMELHVHAPELVLEAGERPVASPVVRCEARRGTWLTNARHERVRVDEMDRILVTLLDGQHDRPALTDCLMEGPVKDGRLQAEAEGQPVTDPAAVRDLVSAELENRLRFLALASLLVG